jgi:hypothetical protein
MMHSNDPWAPGPRRPDGKGTTEQVAEPQAPAQPKPEIAREEDRTDREEPAKAAVSPAKSLAPQKPRPEKPSAFAWAVGAARVVLPVVQKMLPLLEGNVVSAAANLLAPSPRPVDLEPVRAAIGKLQTEQRTLRGQVADQKTALNSIAEELSTIKEGIDRNTAEIRELAEGHLNLRRKLMRLVWMIFILLVLSIAFTTVVCIRLAYILRL